MRIIHYMLFRHAYDPSRPLYFVGTDVAAMRATALYVEPTVESGETIDSERVRAAADTPDKVDILKAGVRAARSGTRDFYLFG